MAQKFVFNPLTGKFDVVDGNDSKTVVVTTTADLITQIAQIQADNLAGTILVKASLDLTTDTTLDLTGISINLNGFVIKQHGFKFRIKGTGFDIRNGSFDFNGISPAQTNTANNQGIEILGNATDINVSFDFASTLAVNGTFDNVIFRNYVGKLNDGNPNIVCSNAAGSWGLLSFFNCLWSSYTGNVDGDIGITNCPFVIKMQKTSGTSLFIQNYRSIHHQAGNYSNCINFITGSNTDGFNVFSDGSCRVTNANVVTDFTTKPMGGNVGLSIMGTTDIIDKLKETNDMVGKFIAVSHPGNKTLEKLSLSTLIDLPNSLQIQLNNETTARQNADALKANLVAGKVTVSELPSALAVGAIESTTSQSTDKAPSSKLFNDTHEYDLTTKEPFVSKPVTITYGERYDTSNGNVSAFSLGARTQLIQIKKGRKYNVCYNSYGNFQCGIIYFNSSSIFVSTDITNSTYGVVAKTITALYDGYIGINTVEYAGVSYRAFVYVGESAYEIVNHNSDSFNYLPKVSIEGINTYGTSLFNNAVQKYSYGNANAIVCKIPVTYSGVVDWVRINAYNSGTVCVLVLKETISGYYSITSKSRLINVSTNNDFSKRIYVGDISCDAGDYIAIVGIGGTSVISYQTTTPNTANQYNQMQTSNNYEQIYIGETKPYTVNTRGFVFEFSIKKNANKIASAVGNIIGGFPILDENFSTYRGVTKYSDPWVAKKIIYVGTSIPAGNSIDIKSYPSILGEILGANVVNESTPSSMFCSVGGVWSFTSTNAESGGVGVTGNVSYENKVIGKNADLLVIDYGINDINNFSGTFYSTDIDNVNRNNILGAFNYLLPLLYADNPALKIVLVSPPNNYNVASSNRTQANIAKLVEMLQKISVKYSLPFINLSYICQINNLNSTYYSDDTIHPNVIKNNIRFAKILANHINMYA